jgi:hypothetical protein
MLYEQSDIPPDPRLSADQAIRFCVLEARVSTIVAGEIAYHLQGETNEDRRAMLGALHSALKNFAAAVNQLVPARQRLFAPTVTRD